MNTYDNMNTSVIDENKFPVLGLRKYFQDKPSDPNKHLNPFSVHKNTEKLLMAREKERRDQKLLKDHRMAVKVYKKTIANRSNRAGVIKQINM